MALFATCVFFLGLLLPRATTKKQLDYFGLIPSIPFTSLLKRRREDKERIERRERRKKTKCAVETMAAPRCSSFNFLSHSFLSPVFLGAPSHETAQTGLSKFDNAKKLSSAR